MPWHDVAMGVMGDCVYDIAEHFVLRWNFIKRDKYKRDKGVDWLMLEGRTGDDEDLVAVQRPKFPCGEYLQHPLSPLDTKPLGQQGFARAQIVRSSADWSSGILTEHSIQNAYHEIISQAQHYVYIENQFFSKIFYPGYYTAANPIKSLRLETSRHRSSTPSDVPLLMPLSGLGRKEESSG